MIIFLIFLTACSEKIVYVKEQVPTDFLECENLNINRDMKTNGDFALFVIDSVSAYRDCKAKLKAVRDFVKQGE
ncbi:hypothetical protein AVBRAN12640_06220 [Campylobacter sp. RM12640]|uniref:hypothetical protein n=1 Tax=unclassified Campylobacter TaxID=2593542 RepID=UPI0030144823|nr:hypothetical protein [Campylobacter sp. RM12640]MBZ7989704.1 hypothetical protein [Campylobacter sp. RM12635]